MAESVGRRDGNWQRGQRRTAPPLIKRSAKRGAKAGECIPDLLCEAAFEGISRAAALTIRVLCVSGLEDRTPTHGDEATRGCGLRQKLAAGVSAPWHAERFLSG